MLNKISFALFVLVASNAIPLVGVIFFGWDLQEILLLYWAEIGIIGVFTLLKMVMAAELNFFSGLLTKLIAIPLFALIYSFAWLEISSVLVDLLNIIDYSSYNFSCPPDSDDLLCQVYFFQLNSSFIHIDQYLFIQASFLPHITRGLREAGLGIAFLSLIINQAVNFVGSYLMKGEFLHNDAFTVMSYPLKRARSYGLTSIVGFFAVIFIRPITLLMLIVVTKICIDVQIYFQESTEKPVLPMRASDSSENK